jgi:hypothetical protein
MILYGHTLKVGTLVSNTQAIARILGWTGVCSEQEA